MLKRGLDTSSSVSSHQEPTSWPQNHIFRHIIHSTKPVLLLLLPLMSSHINNLTRVCQIPSQTWTRFSTTCFFCLHGEHFGLALPSLDKIDRTIDVLVLICFRIPCYVNEAITKNIYAFLMWIALRFKCLCIYFPREKFHSLHSDFMMDIYNPFVYWGQNKAKIFLKVDLSEVSVSATVVQ